MIEDIRLTTETWEDERLSPLAQKASRSQGRAEEEPPDPIRTCFQVDRDRVLHSKPFRRLKHKTQVFIAPEGDHYRTRLTHSLEVSQISRTVARALRLNEDLTEAIALAHDVGHPPFGHAGEQALDEVAQESGLADGFRHDLHSLRVVDQLEALNLTHESRAGIGGHSKGRADLSAADGRPTSTLEASIVRLCDRVAYLNHDLDDAVRAGILTSVPSQYLAIGATQGKRIGSMVADLIRESKGKPELSFSPEMLALTNNMKEWLFETVYLAGAEHMDQVRKAKHVVKALYSHYFETCPDEVEDRAQYALDYVAGMTDRFAIAQYEALFIPQKFKQIVEKVF